MDWRTRRQRRRVVEWIKLVLIENGWMLIGDIFRAKVGVRGFGEENSSGPIINGQVYLTSCMISGFGDIDGYDVRSGLEDWYCCGSKSLCVRGIRLGKTFGGLMDLSETPMNVFSFLFSPSCRVGQSCLES